MPMPSFFGGRRRAFPFDAMNPVLQQTEQKPDIPTGEVTARSGFRGLFTRKSLPNTLNVIGAGLRQMDGGNELDDFLASQQDQQYRRDMFGLRAAQGKREDEETERTRQERLAALAALPENLRPIAPLLTNEAISNAVLPPPPDYQIDAEGRPYAIQNGRVQYGEGRVAVPPRGTGAGGVQYRPMSAEEAQSYGIANPSDFVIGSNGLPRRVGGGGTFPAEQRARVAIMYPPAQEAALNIDRLFESGYSLESDRGAAIASAVPFDGGAVSRMFGSENYNQMVSASSAFEAAMLPILSGAAVTESEARRTIRAALPQIDDTPAVRADKSRRRRQMLNGAAMIGGQPLPFPNLGMPDWATNAQDAVNQSAGDGVNGVDTDLPEAAAADGISAEEWAAMTPDERALWE